MKIAVLTTTFFVWSGMNRVAERQAKDYAREGHEVLIITFEGDIKPPENVRMEVLSQPKNSYFQAFYRLFFFLDLVRVVKIMRALKGFDMVIADWWPLSLIGVLAKMRGAEYVFTYHSIFPAGKEKRGLVEKVYLRINHWLIRWTIGKADKIIAVSRYSSRELYESTGLKSRVVYNRIDEKRFNRGVSGEKIKEVKRKHGLRGRVLLRVGMIFDYGTSSLLLEAF